MTKARADWEARIGQRVEEREDRRWSPLPPPARVTAEAGRGQVTIQWSAVPGAAGYLVQRARGPEGPFVPVDLGGRDVLAVPHGPYVDTTADAGGWYAVASVACADHPPGSLSEPIGPATPNVDGSARIAVEIDAGASLGPLDRPWRPMIGADHLRQLDHGYGPGRRPVGEEFREALRLARTELGVEAVRAHAILSDHPATYAERDGRVVYDFSWAESVYDRLLELGLRPIVELSFMPRDLARDPASTVFDYRAPISPPRDWSRWAELVEAFVRRMVERYGLAEVRDRWAFEVWNEANLSVFWAGTQDEYLRLYEVSARAVKAVDPALRVGGPASAAAGWIDRLLESANETGAPLDFISTHTYGNLPLDLRPVTERHGRPGIPLLWTEWGVSPTHFAAVNDGVFGAPFVLHGMKSAMGRIDALAYWVISDHFEELGPPPRLFHGGFGLLTVGNLRKPRYWALALLERLGSERIGCHVEGDGAGGLVDALATRAPDGRIAILVWNGTLDQSKAEAEFEHLARSVDLGISRLAERKYRVRHSRIDSVHSNIMVAWDKLGRPDWPDERGWAELATADRLEELESERTITPTDERLRLEIELPMPAVSFLELIPV